jgi:hypothetical protein
VSRAPTRPPVKRATATLPEFAARYGIARSTAYELAKRNQLPIPVIRLGRRMVVSRALMERVLSSERIEVESDVPNTA